MSGRMLNQQLYTRLIFTIKDEQAPYFASTLTDNFNSSAREILLPPTL